jgi:hypothetical protein
VVSVARRRAGGSSYWCLTHRADATAKYGKPTLACRGAHVCQPLGEAVALDLDKYLGGIGLWGAVPPVYDTTVMPLDLGIHVHARAGADDKKEIDGTFASVRLLGKSLPQDGLLVSAVEAVYYMVASVFGLTMRQVRCPYCGAEHLDRDWFAVHCHKRHLCGACAKVFAEAEDGVGNPIVSLREAFGAKTQRTVPAPRQLKLKQTEYPGGIQIWGSNPALIWTSEVAEEEGVHIHAYEAADTMPTVDETFSSINIDGINLDAAMVRLLMAQSTLPFLKGRIASIECAMCGSPLLSTGQWAYTPRVWHMCSHCGKVSRASGRLRATVANPLPAMLDSLAAGAPRPRQANTVELVPDSPRR